MKWNDKKVLMSYLSVWKKLSKSQVIYLKPVKSEGVINAKPIIEYIPYPIKISDIGENNSSLEKKEYGTKLKINLAVFILKKNFPADVEISAGDKIQAGNKTLYVVGYIVDEHLEGFEMIKIEVSYGN